MCSFTLSNLLPMYLCYKTKKDFTILQYVTLSVIKDKVIKRFI